MAPMIGYYAHHHGSGHWVRARLVADAYPGRVDIVGTHRDATVVLPPDDDGRRRAGRDANGALHWAPRHSPLLGERTRVLLDWVAATEPALVVVDVSVEVAVQLRLVGVPVVVVRQHGDRTDAPHRLAYRLADSLVAPYPEWAEDPTATDDVRRRTHYVSGFSRFAGRGVPNRGRESSDVVVVIGSGGTDASSHVLRDLARTTGRCWTVLGLDGSSDDRIRFLGRVDDPWPHLCGAGAVVTSAGHNALCEAAEAGAPTIAVAERRPFREQEHKVDVLAAHGAVRRAPSWTDAAAWARTLDDLEHDPPRWGDFVTSCAHVGYARHLAQLAERLDVGR